eukprot:1667709-Rhodomonas_salina.1
MEARRPLDQPHFLPVSRPAHTPLQHKRRTARSRPRVLGFGLHLGFPYWSHSLTISTAFVPALTDQTPALLGENACCGPTRLTVHCGGCISAGLTSTSGLPCIFSPLTVTWILGFPTCVTWNTMSYDPLPWDHQSSSSVRVTLMELPLQEPSTGHVSRVHRKRAWLTRSVTTPSVHVMRSPPLHFLLPALCGTTR